MAGNYPDGVTGNEPEVGGYAGCEDCECTYEGEPERVHDDSCDDHQITPISDIDCPTVCDECGRKLKLVERTDMHGDNDVWEHDEPCDNCERCDCNCHDEPDYDDYDLVRDDFDWDSYQGPY
jgi:hypothetical protein